jgi:TPR repeat protein
MYYAKYIKYKNKYLLLKRNNQYLQTAGFDCDNNRAFKNILGTCWMVAIQTILCFGDVTSKIIEKFMSTIKSRKDEDINLARLKYYLVDTQIKKIMNNPELREILPDLFSNPSRKQKNISHLTNLLSKFIDRYTSKVWNIDITPDILKSAISNTDIQRYNLYNPKRCELAIAKNFFEIYEKYRSKLSNYGGDNITSYLFSNILSVFLCEFETSYKIYYLDQLNDFTSVEYDDSNDIGILITIQGHACCFFMCDGEEKYYNDNDKKIVDCAWKSLLKLTTGDKYLYVKDNGCVELLTNVEYRTHEYKYQFAKINELIVVSKKTSDSKFDRDIKKIFSGSDLDTITDISLLKYLASSLESKDINESNNYLERAADQNDAYSQYAIGMKYINGKGIAKNLEKGIRYLKLSADKGYGGARSMLQYNIYMRDAATIEIGVKLDELNARFYEGLRLFHEYDTYSESNDKESSMRYFEKLADMGNILAQRYVGYQYFKQSNIPKSIEYYKLAADQGDRESQIELGSILNNKGDIQGAIKYYKLVYNPADPSSALVPGRMYESMGGDENIEKAIEYYKLAGKYGYEGLLALGKLYSTKGNYYNLHEAIKYYKSAYTRIIESKSYSIYSTSIDVLNKIKTLEILSDLEKTKFYSTLNLSSDDYTREIFVKCILNESVCYNKINDIPVPTHIFNLYHSRSKLVPNIIRLSDPFDEYIKIYKKHKLPKKITPQQPKSNNLEPFAIN